MFKHTIVRTPCSKICDGITSAPELGQPIYEKALEQHAAYIEALNRCSSGLRGSSEKCSTLSGNLRKVGYIFTELENHLATGIDKGELNGTASGAGGKTPWLQWLDNYLDGLGVEPFGGDDPAVVTPQTMHVCKS